MSRDLFNSIGNKLNDGLFKLDNSTKNTFINDFISELRSKLWEFDNLHRLSKLPPNTNLRITDNDTDYLLCRRVDAVDTDERFYIPHSLFPKEIKDELYDRRDCYVRLGEDNFYHLYNKEDNTRMY